VGPEELSSNPEGSRRFCETTAAKHATESSDAISLRELAVVEMAGIEPECSGANSDSCNHAATIPANHGEISLLIYLTNSN